MNENTNDSDKQPEVITPTSGAETPDASSATEVTETENITEESASTSTDTETPDDSDDSESPEQDNSKEHVDSIDNASETDSGSTPPVESESPEATKEPETPATPEASSETPSAAPTAPAAAVTPPAPTVPAEDTAPSGNHGTPTTPGQSDKKKLDKTIKIVVAVVVLALIVIIAALILGNKSAPSVNNSINTHTTRDNTPTAKIDTWTGKAGNYDWDTATNWSLGVPTTGEYLVFSATSLKATGAVTTFNDNIPSLSVAKVTFDGTGTGFDISGSPLTITSGISQDISQAKGDDGQATVELENSVTFTGDTTVDVAGDNVLNFVSPSGSTSTTTIGSSTIHFISAKSGDIEVSTPIVGTGVIDVPASTTTTGNVDFNTASPNFSGNVMVNSGATVGMGNQNAGNTAPSSTDAFGTGAITIAGGAYLELNEVGSTTYTVPNNITVTGNGGTSASKDNGTYTGAISTCITSAASGCSDNATVTLAGKVTLAGNTEFGAFYGLSGPQVPPSTTVTYVVKNLVTSKDTLTAVPDSKAVIQDSNSTTKS